MSEQESQNVFLPSYVNSEEPQTQMEPSLQYSVLQSHEPTLFPSPPALPEPPNISPPYPEELFFDRE